MKFDDIDEFSYNDQESDILDSPLPESEDSEPEVTIENVNVSMKERVNMINLRSKINNVKEITKEKAEIYKRIKEELLICDNHILELKKEEHLTLEAIKTNQQNNNIAAVYRLQGQLKRVLIEQEGEQDVHNIIKQRLVEAEQDYIKSEIEESKYVTDSFNLKEKEEKYRQNQEKVQKKRITNELMLTKKAQRSLEIRKCDTIKSIEDQEKHEIQLQQSIADAHSKHVSYLQKTSKERRETREKIKKQKSDDQLKKEQSLQKLKADILQTKDNMTAINGKHKATELQKSEKEKSLQLLAIENGGNPKLELKKYKNSIKASEKNEQFLRNIKEGKLKIAEKISREEKNIIKKKQLLPYLFEDQNKQIKLRTAMRRTDLISYDKIIQEDQKDSTQELWKTWDIRSSAGRSSVCKTELDKNDSVSNLPIDPVDSVDQIVVQKRHDDTEQDINIPEFQGMWNTTVDYKVPRDAKNLPIKADNASIMEQEIMGRVLNQLKENIVQPQVVGGKLFKGKSFQSKPATILFENLEVEQIYTQKVILTNTSYGINQCRFERITEQLMDFISIKFSPSGPLSPGMTFEFTVTFAPKLYQDLFGEVFFTSQSERFSIPLVCLTKKCKMSIDRQLIKFNTSVIGETLLQSVILKNSGAKDTFCSIKNKRRTTLTQSNTLEDNKDGAIIENYDQELDECECITTSLGTNKLWLEPYKEQEIIVKWQPTIAGDYLEDFFISFDDEDNAGFDLQVVARAIDVPVYLKDSVVSMDICMVDRLYQDTIVFHSRAATALKMHFKVPNEIKDYLEILPNMGFIQAGQEFKVQLKLVVKSSIYTNKCPFFDVDTGILDVPLSASIANQVKTVDFNVQAVVTVTDLEIMSLGSDPSLIDFGYCTINETKVKLLKIVNKSILPQEFGFTGYPECVEIQPNHGYGVILPKEELIFQVMFSPTKADDFQFQVRCKTIIDRSFSLPCRGIGVHPSLELSKQILTFPYTAVNDMSSIDVFLFNNHVSTNIYTHEPPRIGTEAVIPVGPKTYQISLPDSVDVSIHPCAGTIYPGEKQKLTLFFNPKLSEDSIKVEAAQTVNVAMKNEAQQQWEDEVKGLEMQIELAQTQQQQETVIENAENKMKKSNKKPNRPTSEKRTPNDMLEELLRTGPAKVKNIEPEQVAVDSDQFLKGKLSLLQKFDFNFEIIKAQCYIADGTMSEPDKLSYNSKNVLELELHCPCAKPDLIILSNNGRSFIDFGEHLINCRITKVISVQNISSDVIKLKSSTLDPNGSYQICNALRQIDPGTVANIVVSFCATTDGIYESNWSLFGKKRSKMLKLKFRAVGITPRLEIKELKDNIFNIGTVMVNEFVEKPITITNNSAIDVQYKLNLSSRDHLNQLFGVNNKSGLSAFTLTPQTGVIAAGKSQIVTVTFAPDHESARYTVHGSLYLFDKVESLQFSVRGESKSNALYLKKLSDGFGRPREYLGEIWTNSERQNEESITDGKQLNNLVIILRSSLSKEGSVIEGKGSFKIGCVKTMAASQKKNGEFTIDNVNVLTPLGFTFDSVKGSIEADTEKEVTVSWIPPQQYEIGTVLSSNLNLTLKGETSSSHIIELRAYVK